MYKFGVFLLYLLFVETTSQGDQCFKDGVPGTCVNLRECQSAIDDIRNRKRPQICGFSGADPIVCCPSAGPSPTTTTVGVVATTDANRVTTTTEYVPPYYDYTSNDKGGDCEPLPPSIAAPKTNQKAWNKCLEYQDKLVYPCGKGVALAGELTRVDRCGHSADDLIIGGVDAGRREFPHMVLLGYGATAADANWLCGGSLISEKFILTAGHCTSNRDGGEVSFAIVGALKRTDQVDSSRVYKIKTIHKHPEYKSPVKYNDIALLETETTIQLDQFVVPACLDVGDSSANYEKASATGWGVTEYRGPNADNLQKVTLTKFPQEECATHFAPMRNMAEGFNETTQTCYGDRTQSKDTCQGDSGGPLQIKNKRIHCMYTIVGVTSFGKACGWVGEPGMYTRVVAYVPWIESIVWPE